MTKFEFSIAKDFSRHPGPRFKKQGAHSGEALREVLKNLLETRQGTIVVILDGTAGIGSSFLDEAFGGLIKSAGFGHDIKNRFEFVSRVDPSYKFTIEDSFERAVKSLSVH